MTTTQPPAAPAVPDRAPSLFDLAGDAFRLEVRITEASEALMSDDPAVVAEGVRTLEALLSDQEGNRDALDRKADAWCWVIERVRAQAAARKEHSRRLADLAAADERRADALQQKLIAQLLFLKPGETSFSLPSHEIRSRATERVDLEDDAVDVLPERMVSIKTVRAADKTAIKAALKAGEEVPGAYLIRDRSWSIK